MLKNLAEWIPDKKDGLQIGPMRWTGQAVVSDIGLSGEERVIQIGLIERLILDHVSGQDSVQEIQRKITNQGLSLDAPKTMNVLNKFAFFGLIDRPFETVRGLQTVDADATKVPSMRDDQMSAGQSRLPLLRLWEKLTKWVNKPTFIVLVVGGILAAVALFTTLPDALASVGDAGWLGLLLGLFGAIIWSMLTTVIHENGHAAVFHRVSGRRPYLAVTRFGLLLMPNTHMPGFALFSARQRMAVIAAGPLLSMVLALVPVLTFVLVDQPIVQTIAAVCVVVDAIIIGLAISPFPNTDATRFIEAAVGVDQLQAVAFRTLTREYPLPTSLSRSTRFAVRVYPGLLLVTTTLWLAVIIWAIRLIFG